LKKALSYQQSQQIAIGNWQFPKTNPARPPLRSWARKQAAHETCSKQDQNQDKAQQQNQKVQAETECAKGHHGGRAPEPPEPGKEFDLKELARLPHHRIVEFPQMKGRTVERIRFYSSSDENTIAIRFRNRTQLTFSIEPALVLRSDLLKMHRWDTETIKEWPPIHSEPRNPNQ